MNRRSFVKASSFAALGGLAWLQSGCAERTDEASPTLTPETADDMATAGDSLARIGVQLYTVRGLMEQDVAGTLGQVAAAGYDEVEFAGYFGHSPTEIKAMLDAAGLAAPSSHVAIDRLRNNMAEEIEAAQTVGHQYIVCPWLDENERSLDDFRAHAALFNQVGEQCRDAGIQFAYHNHDFEFVETDGQMPYDLLLAETDADLVKMELDLFWITVGGQDPLAYFRRYPGRFPLCHVKDRDAEGEMVAVGAGTIDFAAIFAQSEQAGLKHYFVEHDNPEDPVASITQSAAYLRQLRF